MSNQKKERQPQILLPGQLQDSNLYHNLPDTDKVKNKKLPVPRLGKDKQDDKKDKNNGVPAEENLGF